MIYNQDITLDLNTNTSYLVVGAKQGDNNGRTLTATILENGEPFRIPETTQASYRIRKPNGDAGWNSAKIYPSEHKVVITLTAQDLSTSGRCYADILLTIGTIRIGTVSFVIDVQAAPNIVEGALASEAFGYLYNMVDQAGSIIESAQAWAEGKRSTEDVLGDSYSIYSTRGLNVSLNFETFKQKINPPTIGKVTVYTFTYTSEGWEYGYNNEIVNMPSLGFTIIGTPDRGDIIEVTASFADPAWHNNSLYYRQRAEAWANGQIDKTDVPSTDEAYKNNSKFYKEVIQNSRVGTVTTANPGKPAEASATFHIDTSGTDDAYEFDFTLPSVKPHATISVTPLPYTEDPTASVQVHDVPGKAASGEEGNLQKSFDFALGIPRGIYTGISNDVTVRTVNTLAPGTNAAVRVTATDAEVEADKPREKQFIFEFDIPRGNVGATGAVGQTGPKGDTGAKGNQGIQGQKGDKGDKGDKGNTGDQGPKGDKGDQGSTGPRGLQGNVGAQGPKGDAFTYDDFTEEQLAALKGPKGDSAVSFTIGSVTAAASGQGPSVTNSGTATDVVLDFVLPDNGMTTSIDDTSVSLQETWSSQKVDNKINYINQETEVSGDIVEFNALEAGVPLKEIIVTIDPIQDLHGYDHPWPGGAGKNLLDISKCIGSGGSTLVLDGNEFVLTCENVTWGSNSMVRDSKINFKAGVSYVFSAYCTVLTRDSNYQSPKLSVRNETNNMKATANLPSTDNTEQRISFVYTPTEDFIGYLSVVITGSTAGSASVKVRNPMVEIGSAVTDYEPYENICPISGWTGLAGKRTGGNVASIDSFYASGTNTQITKDPTSGSIAIVNTSAARYCGTSAWREGIIALRPFPKGAYTVSFDITGTITTGWIAGTRSTGTNVFDGTERVGFSSPGHYSFTFDSSAWTYDKYLSISRDGNETSDLNVTISNFTIVPGAAEGSFEPYVSQNISINWQSQAGEVYGGYVDVISGKLTVNYRYGYFGPAGSGAPYIISGDPISTYPETYVYYDSTIGNAIVPNETNDITDAICSHLPSISRTLAGATYKKIGVFQFHSGNTNQFRIVFPREEQFSTNEKLNEWFQAQITAQTPFAVCFPLKETIEYQLTPQEIITLLGKNILWINNSSVKVVYTNGLISKINKKISQLSQRTAQMDQIAVIDNKVDNWQSAIEDMHTDVANNTQAVTNMQSQITSLDNNKILPMQSSITNLTNTKQQKLSFQNSNGNITISVI